MIYETKIQKGQDGWEAISEAVLGQTPQGTRILKLRTSKARGGLSAFASVVVRSKKNGYLCETCVIFQDFTKANIAPIPCKRVTEKAVRAAHDSALTFMDELIVEAQNFYQKQAD
tara:strand:- start:577 stop:921 length:345 start_codon:yes stop_codon:yes gene_type:complete